VPESSAPAIGAAADAGDRGAQATLASFFALLGGFAGDVVLTLGARGGLYVGGGVVPRMAERFFASDFMARFKAKGLMADYLAAVPVALITDTMAALAGAAAALDVGEG
jgi:glucokinase